jgi:DNA-binding NtrC family response regulator
MDPRLQAKLLRAIQEREIDRVGGAQPIEVDIRLLANSNRNLEEEVRVGKFREDLFFRLNVVNLRLPSLRERPADIPILAEHFVQKCAKANGVPGKTLSKATLDMLAAHHWRGNVRELENTMHRAVLLARGPTIELDAIMLTSQLLAPERSVAVGSAAVPAASRPTASAAPGDESAAGAAYARATGLVGRTVADSSRRCSTASATAPTPPISSASRSARSVTSSSSTARKA